MKRIRAEKFIFAVQSRGDKRKVLQVIFNRSDGSLFVNFPYFMRAPGLVGVVTIPQEGVAQIDLSRQSLSKVTTTLVKYTHHPDGRVHFSQDGRVVSSVRKKSILLSSAEGHIFTVHFQGLDSFEPLDESRDSGPPRAKRTVLGFNFADLEPEAYKIVGRWYSASELSKQHLGGENPTFTARTPEGKPIWGFLVGPPVASPTGDHVLMVSCESTPLLDANRDALLLFIGGFETLPSVEGAIDSLTALTLIYPVSDYDELLARLGSIDLRTGTH